MKNLDLPVEVLEIIKSSKSDGTWRQYESALSKWASFCKSKDWSVWEVNISHYLIFLSKLYYDGLSYSVLNSTRSALSSVFGKIDNCAIGEHKSSIL